VEINLDLAANAQIKAMKAIDQGARDLGFWHLQNISDFMRNRHALVNLERFRIKDSASANSVKSYIDGVELIFPQIKFITDQQKKLMPKYYQSSYYKRRNSYSYNNSNYNT
jgi:hypothetical protein